MSMYVDGYIKYVRIKNELDTIILFYILKFHVSRNSTRS